MAEPFETRLENEVVRILGSAVSDLTVKASPAAINPRSFTFTGVKGIVLVCWSGDNAGTETLPGKRLGREINFQVAVGMSNLQEDHQKIYEYVKQVRDALIDKQLFPNMGRTKQMPSRPVGYNNEGLYWITMPFKFIYNEASM